MSPLDPICPCCGKPVRAADQSADMLAISLDLSKTQIAIWRAVMARRGDVVPTASILRAAYPNDRDAPGKARQYSTFKEKLCLIRPKLACVGLAAENAG